MRKQVCLTLLFLATLLLSASTAKEPSEVPKWQQDWVTIQQIGKLLAEEEHPKILALFDKLGDKADFPLPSSTKLYAKRQEKGLPTPEIKSKFGYSTELTEKYLDCMNFGAYQRAMELTGGNYYRYNYQLSIRNGDFAKALAESKRGAQNPVNQHWEKRDFQIQHDAIAAYLKRHDSLDTLLDMVRTLFILQRQDGTATKRYLADPYLALTMLTQSELQPRTDVQKMKLYSTLAFLLQRVGDAEQVAIYKKKLDAIKTGDGELESSLMVSQGNILAKAGKFEDALWYYQLATSRHPKAKFYGIAQFNLAVCLKNLERYPEAIEEYSKLFGSSVNDRDPGSNFMEAYRNYRPKACRSIAGIYFKQKNYAKALEYYLLGVEKYPSRSWCGTCRHYSDSDDAFNVALCYDWLGESAKAIQYYRQSDSMIALSRIAGIYAATNDLDNLRDKIEEEKKAYLAKRLKYHEEKRLELFKKYGSEKYREYKMPTKERILEYFSLSKIEPFIKIHFLAKEERWDALVDLLQMANTAAGPEEKYVRDGNAKAVLVAKLLASSPKETVPLILARLSAKHRYSSDGKPRLDTGKRAVSKKWACYALGLCATDEAILYLKSQAIQQPHLHSLPTLIYSLSLAGKKGEKAIDEIETLLDETTEERIKRKQAGLRLAITRHRENKLAKGGEDAVYPKISPTTKLP